MHFVIECGFFHGENKYKIHIISLELANIAANAVIAKQAAEAKLLLTAQALTQCRQETNPFLPGNTLLGPSRAHMWAPDPCLQQEQDHAEASLALAQITNKPTQANIGAQPAPQLSDTLNPNIPADPLMMTPENVVQSPSLQSQWSPSSIENTMNEIWDQMMEIAPPEISDQEIMEVLGQIHHMIIIVGAWLPHMGPVTNLKFTLDPKNKDWINHWAPK
nr:MAG: nonstructural protein 2 [Protoparvovirus sp.]